VETQGQLDFLRELKCDEVQGYFFSKPVLPVEIPAKLQQPLPLGAQAGNAFPTLAPPLRIKRAMAA
jgi:EAL domain-containing protein (putative c-di-GMP-specific phosphodiesterase class I)